VKHPSLYIHIPFCRRACFYCSFTRLKYNEDLAAVYADALCRELELRKSRDDAMGTIYFGGGSPAVIADRFLEAIVHRMRENFNTEHVTEMSVEINPEECTGEKLDLLKALGFTRISVGAQSFSDQDLLYLGRNHNAADAKAALIRAIQGGFDSVSADLIIGLPGQTRETVKANTDILSGSGVHHISAYMLEGVSDFHGRVPPGADHQAEIYRALQEELDAAGYDQYEVSNFCRDGALSRHNLNYWKGGSYVGAGLSAAGFEQGEDYRNYSDMNTYIRSVDKGILPVEGRTRHDPVKRSVITGLRLTEGIPKKWLSGYEQRIGELQGEGYLEEEAGNVRVPPSKLSVLHDILTFLI